MNLNITISLSKHEYGNGEPFTRHARLNVDDDLAFSARQAAITIVNSMLDNTLEDYMDQLEWETQTDITEDLVDANNPTPLETLP